MSASGSVMVIIVWLKPRSYSLTVFSPSGKLVQIEHALAAVSQGTTSLGIKGTHPLTSPSATNQLNAIPVASNGIVIATEKKSSSILIDDSMLEKVAVICPNIGIVYSGMGPDFRILVAKARKSAQSYWKIYGEYPPTRVLTQEIATVMQQATQSGCVHQFGSSWRWNTCLVTWQWRTAVWCFTARCGVRRQPRTDTLSG